MHARTPYAYYTVNVYCSQRCQRLQCARIIITWYTLNVLLRTILLETRFAQYDQRTHSLYQPASYYDCVICVSIGRKVFNSSKFKICNSYFIVALSVYRKVR